MFCSNCGFQNDDNSAFCENCGSPLQVDNSAADPNPAPTPNPVSTPNPAQPNYQQPIPNQQVYYQQPMPAQASPGGEAFANSFKALKDIFVRPVTVAQNLAEPNGVISGLVYMGIKCLVLIIIALIGSSSSSGIDSEIGKAIVFLIFVSLGVNCLEAVLIRGFGIAFRLDISMKQSFTAVGVASWFSALLWIVCYIFIRLVPEFGLVLLFITIPIPSILSLTSICHMAKGDNNRKAYMYIVVRVICLLATYIALRVLVGSYVEDIVGAGSVYRFNGIM